VAAEPRELVSVPRGVAAEPRELVSVPRGVAAEPRGEATEPRAVETFDLDSVFFAGASILEATLGVSFFDILTTSSLGDR
jgi:hypothetical protein